MFSPSLIGIGAQRAATTWIYECLKAHPDIFMPPKKEIHFFNKNYDKGIDWYLDHFKEADGYKAIGEVTPNYLNNALALPRIAEHFPQSKLFVILREPISRAYSAYRLLNRQFGKCSFQEACESSEYFLRLSCYAEDLQRVFQYFPKKQIKIFLFEDVKTDPIALLSDLYDFVEVDSAFRPQVVHSIFNPVVMPNVQKVCEQFKLGQSLDTLKRTALGQSLKKMLVRRQSSLLKKNATVNKQQSYGISESYLDYLKGYFHDDILQVEKLINRDLSSWL